MTAQRTRRALLRDVGVGAGVGVGIGVGVAVAADGARAGAPPAAAPTAAIDEVKALVERQRQAWNAGDLDAFCAVYADDCVFLSPSGLTVGRDAVLARYQKRYGRAKETMGTLGFEHLNQQVGVDVVTLAMRWSLQITSSPGGAKAQSLSGLTLICFARRADGAWRLTQDASM